jgi:hypothetical protein
MGFLRFRRRKHEDVAFEEAPAPFDAQSFEGAAAAPLQPGYDTYYAQGASHDTLGVLGDHAAVDVSALQGSGSDTAAWGVAADQLGSYAEAPKSYAEPVFDYGAQAPAHVQQSAYAPTQVAEVIYMDAPAQALAAPEHVSLHAPNLYVVEQPAGEDPMAETTFGEESREVPLGTLIFQAGLLSSEQLEDALADGVRSRKRLGEILVARGWLSERDLGRLLAAQKGLPFVDAPELRTDPNACQLLPDEASAHEAVVLRLEEGRPVVALADPTEENLAAVAAALDDDARFVVAPRDTVLAAIELLPDSKATPEPAAPPTSPENATASADPTPGPQLHAPMFSQLGAGPASLPLPTDVFDTERVSSPALAGEAYPVEASPASVWDEPADPTAVEPGHGWFEPPAAPAVNVPEAAPESPEGWLGGAEGDPLVWGAPPLTPLDGLTAPAEPEPGEAEIEGWLGGADGDPLSWGMPSAVERVVRDEPAWGGAEPDPPSWGTGDVPAEPIPSWLVDETPAFETPAAFEPAAAAPATPPAPESQPFAAQPDPVPPMDSVPAEPAEAVALAAPVWHDPVASSEPMSQGPEFLPDADPSFGFGFETPTTARLEEEAGFGDLFTSEATEIKDNLFAPPTGAEPATSAAWPVDPVTADAPVATPSDAFEATAPHPFETPAATDEPTSALEHATPAVEQPSVFGGVVADPGTAFDVPSATEAAPAPAEDAPEAEAQPVAASETDSFASQPAFLWTAPVETPEAEPVEAALEVVPAVASAQPTVSSDAALASVVLRLADGERVAIGDFPTEETAKEHAASIVWQLTSKREGLWPFFGGRFLRPETIVSVDVVD